MSGIRSGGCGRRASVWRSGATAKRRDPGGGGWRWRNAATHAVRGGVWPIQRPSAGSSSGRRWGGGAARQQRVSGGPPTDPPAAVLRHRRLRCERVRPARAARARRRRAFRKAADRVHPPHSRNGDLATLLPVDSSPPQLGTLKGGWLHVYGDGQVRTQHGPPSRTTTAHGIHPGQWCLLHIYPQYLVDWNVVQREHSKLLLNGNSRILHPVQIGAAQESGVSALHRCMLFTVQSAWKRKNRRDVFCYGCQLIARHKKQQHPVNVVTMPWKASSPPQKCTPCKERACPLHPARCPLTTGGMKWTIALQDKDH